MVSSISGAAANDKATSKPCVTCALAARSPVSCLQAGLRVPLLWAVGSSVGSEIDWIEAAGYYASLHVGARTHLMRRSMAGLEQELDPAAFCRIHRSTIVKLDRVRSLELNDSGEYEVLLRDGRRLREPALSQDAAVPGIGTAANDRMTRMTRKFMLLLRTAFIGTYRLG